MFYTKINDFIFYSINIRNEESNKLIVTYFFNKIRSLFKAKIASTVKLKDKFMGYS